MKNYIAYLDLLGIKDLAKYSSEKYFSAMEDFRNHLIQTTSIFNEKGFSENSEIFFFSDSAFIETDDIVTLFNYLISLRKSLNRNQLFFTAAITIGNLNAFNFCGQNLSKSGLNESTKRLLKNKERYLKGTIFQSKEISDVYVLQNNLKGIGVYINDTVFIKWKTDIRNEILNKLSQKNAQKKNQDSLNNNLEDLINNEFQKSTNNYVTKSFYFPSINTKTAYEYYDLKLTASEQDISFYEIIIERYHNSNVKNKKYGRFYLSHIANWISSTDFSTIINTNDNSFNLENAPLIFKKLVLNEDFLIKELKNTAHCFEYLYFFLLNHFYFYFDNYNFIIAKSIESINHNLRCKKYLTKIDELPNCVLSLANKERFINDYHRVLNNLSNEKEQAKKKREQAKKKREQVKKNKSKK